MNILKKANNDGAKIYLNTFGYGLRTGRRELTSFTEQITQDEKILCIATAKFTTFSDTRTKRSFFENSSITEGDKGVVIITTERAVFLSKHFFKKQMTTIDGSDINSITMDGHWFTGSVQITTYGMKYQISDINKKCAVDVAKALKELKKNTKKENTVSSTQIHNALSKMDELKKAKELLDLNIITNVEFQSIKEKFLN